MAVERYGSKTDVVVKLILVFFISLLSFSIGTFVGKKFSDNQHKISQLEPGSGEKTEGEGEHGAEHAVAAAEGEHGAIKTDVLSDEEVAKLAEEFVTDDTKPARSISSEPEHGEAKGHGEARVPAETKAHGDAKGHGEAAEKEVKKEDVKVQLKKDAHAAGEHAAAPAEHIEKVAKKVAEGKSTSEPEHAPKKEGGPSTALPDQVATSAAGKFTVQVSAYPKEDEAQSMAADLKNKGFSAFYVQAKVKGQTWYRVSVGLFTTQKEAQAYREDLLARAKVSSAIVQKIN